MAPAEPLGRAAMVPGRLPGDTERNPRPGATPRAPAAGRAPPRMAAMAPEER